jgi:fibronectin type 3 domain-containing protein
MTGTPPIGKAPKYFGMAFGLGAGSSWPAVRLGSSTPVVVPDTIAPTVPANLTATAASSSQINLSWSASTDDTGVVGYNIYRNGTRIGTSVINSFSDTGLNALTPYSYTVSSVDNSGNVSAQSETVTVATLAAADTTAPVISNIEVTGVTDSSATITFFTDEPATSSIDYGFSSSYGLVAADDGFATAHIINLSGLSASSIYYFQVRSEDSASNVGVSAEGSFATAASPVTEPVPAAVTDLSFSQPAKSSVRLSWTAPEAGGMAQSYDARYSISPITEENWDSATSALGEPVPTGAGTAQSFIVGNLRSGTRYYAAIKTINSQGLVSALSNVVSFSTKRNRK